MNLIKNISPRYIIWWLTSLGSFLLYDIGFCNATSYAPFHFVSFVPFLILAATVVSLPAAFSRRDLWQWLTLAVVDIVLIVNLMYCRTYGVHIPLDSYGLASNLSDFGGSVVDSLRPADLMFPLLALIAALALRRQRRQSRSVRPLSPWLKLGATAAIAACAYATTLPYGGFLARMQMLATEVELQHTMSPVYTVFGCMAYDLATSESELTDAQRSEVEGWLERHKNLTDPYAALCVARDDSLKGAGVPPRNIVLVMCESLESWPLGLTLEGKTVTPFLNSLIADTALTYYAPRIETQVRDGRSIDGQLLIVAGQYPLLSGVYSTRYANNTYHSVPEAMGSRGARTLLFTPDRLTVWNQGAVAEAFGIKTVTSHDDFDLTAPGTVIATDNSIGDAALLSQTADMLHTDQRLWPEGEYAYVQIVTHSGHNPFTLPEELDSLGLTGNYPAILHDYLVAANYTDRALRPLVSYLQSRSDWANTTLIITGDHEGLAGYRDDLSKRYSWVSGERLTPLIIVNSPYQGTDSTTLGQVDIYSAILDIAGLYGRTPWRGAGRSPFGDAVETGGARQAGDLIIRHRLMK